MNTNTTQDQPQPGKAYSLATLATSGTWANAEIKTTGLPLGARVSYSDMANPRRVYVVIETAGGTYGQKAIREDGQNASNVSQSYIDGPGGWERAPGEASAEEIERLKQLHTDYMQGVKTEQARQREERAQRGAIGEQLLAERMPAGTAAVLIATYMIDDCDSMTDYFHAKTGRRVILAFSSHKRDLFAEMRKAALLLPETAHLATASPQAEHREKYSMGGGFYLKESGRYSTGWKVCKTYLADAEDIAGQPDGWAPHFTAPAVVKESLTVDAAAEAAAVAEFEAQPGKPAVRFNSEKNGIELSFPTKPAAAVLETLKRHGWRWSRFSSCWYHRASTTALNAAAQAAALTPEQVAALQSKIDGEHTRQGDHGMEIACGIA